MRSNIEERNRVYSRFVRVHIQLSIVWKKNNRLTIQRLPLLLYFKKKCRLNVLAYSICAYVCITHTFPEWVYQVLYVCLHDNQCTISRQYCSLHNGFSWKTIRNWIYVCVKSKRNTNNLFSKLIMTSTCFVLKATHCVNQQYLELSGWFFSLFMIAKLLQLIQLKFPLQTKRQLKRNAEFNVW